MLQDVLDDLEKAPDELADILEDDVKAAMTNLAKAASEGEKPPKSVVATLTNWINTIQSQSEGLMKKEKVASWLADLAQRLIDLWPDL